MKGEFPITGSVWGQADVMSHRLPLSPSGLIQAVIQQSTVQVSDL